MPAPSAAAASTARDWLSRAQAHLEGQSVPEARASAEFLLASVLKVGRAELALRGSQSLTQRQRQHYWNLVLDRARRLPLAYVLGSQPFLGLDMAVSREVLVPRPETEELVWRALELLKGRERESLQVLEVGTGSGCIAVSLSVRLPGAMVYATDISQSALALAARNAQAHHRTLQVRLLREDLFKPDGLRRGWADLVISNPPYIPTRELSGLPEEVRHEPRLALDGGPDGLDALRAIVNQAPRHLKKGGWLALEIGEGQGAAVEGLLRAAGFSEPRVHPDAQGLDRVAVAKW